MFILDLDLFPIPDPDPGSRGLKKHWISDTDPQHCIPLNYTGGADESEIS
jgi:hypothetical protein